ncbi:MAG: T9SS type A sorting domain-containing protein [Calditrichaeota bacterium]|nr:T9SS type A sorting domain-containing protein [Calditrichota bacterium]
MRNLGLKYLKKPLRVGGQTYRIGTQTGWITQSGYISNQTYVPPSAISRDNPRSRIYRIRRDWQQLSINSDEIIEDAADIYQVPINEVTESMAQSVLDQYARDWAEWPADLGAPYYDHNANGQWDPGIDEPGIADADQVIWFVMNDVDSTTTTYLYGSRPIGLEIQVTLWSYRSTSPELDQTIFKRYLIINKSGLKIDSMFIAQWSDVDIGDYTNDLVGCNPDLQLMFGYNGVLIDDEFNQYGLAPPATGYLLLQGPLVSSPGDTGYFMFKKLPNYRNLSLHAFGYFAAGSPISDPPLGDYIGTIDWYKMMNGFIPNHTSDINDLEPFVHGAGPDQGKPTRFPLDGDPYRQDGDIDGTGNNMPPGDRRIYASMGPFTMLPGDTQEIVIAVVAGKGRTQLESVHKLFQLSEKVRNFWEIQQNEFILSPIIQTRIDFKNDSLTQVFFSMQQTDVERVELHLFQYDGSALDTLLLFDDGLHQDGQAGDGLFANVWLTHPIQQSVYANTKIQYKNGRTYYWIKTVEGITTSGPVEIVKLMMGSDNINHDLIANSGENVRFTLELHNRGIYPYQDVSIALTDVLQPDYITDYSMPNDIPTIKQIMPRQTVRWEYSPQNAYYQIQIAPDLDKPTTIQLVFDIFDMLNNTWVDTISLSIVPLSHQPQEHLMTKIAGKTTGRLGYRLLDPSLLTGHQYRVHFNRKLNETTVGYTLIDLTTGDTLLKDQPYPDEYAHNSKVIDGFVITRGTTLPEDQVGPWEWKSEGPRWLSGVNFGGAVFFGSIDKGENGFGSTLPDSAVHSIKIVFDTTIVTYGAVYRRDLGYAYAGIGKFYGAVYDISNPDSPRRVNVVFVEDARYKEPDLIWNPGLDNGDREYLFIMHSDYDESNYGGYDDNNFGPTSDVMWFFWPRLRSSNYRLYQYPAEFYVYISFGIDIGTIYEFTPRWIGIQTNDQLPLTYKLFQNFPNPFNPITTIRFSIPQQLHVKLEIYNLLGQRVRTLMDRELKPGYYTVQWDGRNENGIPLGSGIYFYRLTTEQYVKTRKMILIK